MDSLFEFEHAGEIAASKLFSFHSETRLFHFLNDTAAGGDIMVSAPHLTDAAAVAPSGVHEAAPVAPATMSAVKLDEPVSGTTAESDTFLKSLTDDKKKNADQDLVLQSLVKSEEKGVEKRKSILGELPKIDTSLFIDQEFHLKKQLSYVRIAFALLITLGFGLYIFFFTQLNVQGNFFTTSNVGTKLETTSDALKSTMTEVNYFRYKTAAEYLDQFFYGANEYLQKYEAWQAADEKKKGELAANLEKAKSDLIKPFESARDTLAKQNYTVIFREKPLVESGDTTPEIRAEEEKRAAAAEFNDLLKTEIGKKKLAVLDDLKNAKSATDKETKRAELRTLNEMYQLVGNAPLLKLISTDAKKMSHEQLRKHIIALSAKYNNRLAFVFQIKDRRVPWAALIKEIYAKTEATDERFATKLFEDLGGIQYTGFDFDGTAGRLTISGNVKDADGLNFNILATLIDQLEGSSKLKDVDMRNFSKTFSEKDGYEGNFKIELSLQAPGDTDIRDKIVDLSNGAKLFSSDETLQKVMKKIQEADVTKK